MEVHVDTPRALSRARQHHWRQVLEKVRYDFDYSYIILWGEILETLAAARCCVFSGTCGMQDSFGGCDYEWSLSCGSLRLVRSLCQELNDSGQRVVVERDSVSFSGMPAGLKCSWSGNTNFGTTLTIQGLTTDQQDRVMAIAHELFAEVRVTRDPGPRPGQAPVRRGSRTRRAAHGKVVRQPRVRESAGWRRFVDGFFGTIDPYIAWHDGVDTMVDRAALRAMTADERRRAEKKLVAALAEAYDERWLIGLRELGSTQTVRLCRRHLATSPDMSAVIRLSEEVLFAEPEAPEIDQLLACLSDDGAESVAIAALTSLARLASAGRFRGALLETLNARLLVCVADPRYLVRYHAYATWRRLNRLEAAIAQDDPIFALLVNEGRPRDYRKAVGLLQKKRSER